MRKLFAATVVAITLAAAPALAADYQPYTEYPQINVPPLPQADYGLGGSFYLRGSLGGNLWTAVDGQYCNCVQDFSDPGYGYSAGVGFGYETGTGFRTDVTLDYLNNDGLTSTSGSKVNLKSGLLLANVYYDFSLDGALGAEGGPSLYVGAGIGAAKNWSEIVTGGSQQAWGTSLEAAGAVMAGVSYDMGNWVADLGYRGIYMNKVMSQPPSIADAYVINNNFIHEVRASMRYRFN